MQNIEEFIRMFNLWNNFNTKKKKIHLKAIMDINIWWAHLKIEVFFFLNKNRQIRILVHNIKTPLKYN